MLGCAYSEKVHRGEIAALSPWTCIWHKRTDGSYHEPAAHGPKNVIAAGSRATAVVRVDYAAAILIYLERLRGTV
jgi:hypothetical protein